MAGLDTALDEVNGLLGAFVMAAVAPWESGAWNSGQASIIMSYVLPALESWADEAADGWPWNNAVGDYEISMYDAYDSEVMDRAFSGTINEPISEMNQIQDVAQSVSIIQKILL